jgi:hypothetical protein
MWRGHWSHNIDTYLSAIGNRVRIEIPVHYSEVKGVALGKVFYDMKSQKIVVEATLLPVMKDDHAWDPPVERNPTPLK